MSKPAKAKKTKAPIDNPELLGRQGAARDLGLKPKTLDNWRVAGRGPKYLKLGSRVLYPRAELDAFKAANLRQSTSERSAA